MKHIIINMFVPRHFPVNLHTLTPRIFIHVKPQDKMYVEKKEEQEEYKEAKRNKKKVGTKSRDNKYREQRILLAN